MKMNIDTSNNQLLLGYMYMYMYIKWWILI